jgi:hypothetical protein
LRPLFFRSDRGRGGGLSSPSLDGGLEEFRGVCRSLRLRQLPAQRGHQRGQRLIPGTSVITRHTRTLLPPKIIYHYSRILPGRLGGTVM